MKSELIKKQEIVLFEISRLKKSLKSKIRQYDNELLLDNTDLFGGQKTDYSNKLFQVKAEVNGRNKAVQNLRNELNQKQKEYNFLSTQINNFELLTADQLTLV